MSQPSKPSLEPIAIIGLGGIFPDAADIPTYWKNILAKKNCISEVPADHWDWRLYYSEDRSAPDKTYSKIGGFVRGFHFDSLPLRIPPHVAKQMDVVQQFAVACTAEALRDAGYDKKNLDSSRTAVIFGNAMGGPKSEDSNLRVYTAKIRKHLLTSATLARLSSQEQEAVADEMVSSIKAGLLAITEDSMPGELSNVIAGRVANVFNLNGPNFTVDAACAASLAAVSQAVNGLRLGQFDMAVTGGIDQMMAPPAYVKFSKIGALSAEGSCPFDASADGFVMGEGAGVMVLKRVRDAVRDGDRIYALIRAIGASSDGRGKGITAPNPKGQKLAIERVFSQVDYVPADVGLLEAHGTSTKVGDVVEVQTASELFGSAPPRSIALGSVKSQIGHLKAAAGVASLIKTALAVHHKTLPPSINFKTPNPGIDWAHSPFFVPTEPAPWAAKDGKPRRAHVSAFGFGGTNFHVALEEATPQTLNWTPELPLAQADAAPVAACDPAALSTGTLPDALGGEVFFTCGKSPKEVLSKLKDLRGRVPAGGPLSALAREWNTHARSGSYVLNIAAESPEKLAQKLDLVLASKAELWEKTPPAFRPKAIHPSRRPAKKPKIAFMFPGQGLQYVDMLRDMAAKYAVVAETFREADEVMTPRIGKLTDILFSKPGESAEALAERQERMRQTEVTQPAVLTADIALLRLLRSYGVEADVVYGHSLGEYAALVAAGALEFKDALVTVSCRAKEIASIHVKDPGKMASISWPVSKVEPVLKDIPGYVVAANKNCPIQTVLAGESQAVEEAVSRFTALGAQAQLIEVSHAFHSNIMAPAREPYARFLKTIALKSPRIPVLANVNADFFPSEPDAMRDLMVLQMSSPVEFIRQTERLYEDGVRVFVELGPKRALTAFVQTTLEDKPDVQIFASNHPKRGGIQEFNDLLARLDAAGVPLDIDAAASKGLGHTPAYRAWLAAPSSGERTPGAAQESPAASAIAPSWDFYDGAVVVSGVAAGTPGSWEKVFREDNIDALLRGQNLISRLPDEESERQIDKSILRLIKSEDGNHRFERIQSAAEVVRLAALAGEFDLAKEFGFTDSLVHAMDSASRLAVAAGILALRDAGIPLLRTYKRTTLGGFLPSGWALPESLRAGTGVIFASAYANLGAMASEVASYLGDKYRGKPLRELSALIDELLTRIQDPQERESIQTWRDEHLRAYFDRFGSRQAPYEFSRDFLLRVMPLAHSQLMQWIGAKGPGMHLNAACASTTEAVGVAEDWIRLGRAERVIVIAGDDASGPDIREWMLSGFVAAGAATTAAVVSEAALPFDRRRHGMIVGMGAAGLVIERTESVQARGMRPLTELLASQYENSAFHATRLEPEHVAGVMERLVSKAERRRGVRRADIAAKALFMSHETYTPARGGSASAEVQALKRTFGPDAEKIVVTNTKGFHGHSMGASVEDPTAVRALTSGVLPPIANYRDPDPDLAGITLSRGGEYDLEYALRLAAGFGSQIAMTLMRRVLRKGESRIADPVRHKDWLKSVSGQAEPSLEVVQNTLRIREGAATSGNAVIPAKAGTQGMPSPVSSAKLDSGLRRNDEKAAPAAASSVSGAAGEDAVRAAVTALVSEKTGYPADMLQADLDMEADLGIDTVKQAELFGLIRERYGIPRKENLSLKDYPTLNHVVRFVLVNSSSSTQQTHPSVIPAEGNVVIPAKAGTAENVVIPAKAGTQGSPSAVSPAASLDSGFRRNDEKKSAAAPAPQKAPAPVGEDAVRSAVTALVSEKTGYPADMLEPDLDMEADLGIDTVKQAELLGLIREKYGIPRTENLSLKDYPTLRHVIRFVLENSSSSSTQQTHPSVIPAEGNVVIPAKAGTAENVVIPAKAGTQGSPSAVSPAASLDSGFRRNDEKKSAAAPAPQKAPAPVGEDAVRAAVTALVSEKTGYPADMLEPDLDMEADLGIDTVKQAELLGLIREKYGIPRTENLSLKDYPTLRHVIRFVLENSSSSSTQQTHPSVIPAEGNVVIPAKAGTAENVVIPAKAGTQGAPSAVSPAASLDSGLRRNDDTVKAADPRFKRWVLQAGPRPANGEPVRLDPERAVLLLAADAEEAAPFAQAVIKAGGTPIILKAAEWKDAESAETSVRATLKGRKAQGLWDLTPLSHPADPKLTPASFDKSYRRSVRALFLAAKALREDLGKDSHVLSFTRMDGSHGLDEGKFHPLCGASTGLVKALRRELAGSRVQALDFDAQTSPESMAETALRELGSDDPRAEVGFLAGERRGLALRVKDLPEFAKRKIGSRSVVLITGGGQGLGAVLAREIARKTRCSIVVLGRTSLGKEATTWARMDAQEMKSLKQRMWEELKSDTARRATPALLEREFSKVSKAAEVHRNIEELCRLGSKASYIECDLSDAASTSKAVKEAVRLYHNIDVIIHAAGLDESRFLADKKPEDFDRVFRAKAHGAVHLLGCVPPIGAQLWVFFTSVVGRFGNAAQTDYAAANDFLAKLAHRMRAQRRLAVACDLSAFSEVGMATRGSVEAFLKSQGVEFMPPSVGMGMIYREMLSGDAGEVVLAGALGGMDSDKLMTSAPEETASEAAATPKGPRPLFDRIVREEAGKAVLGKNFSLESDPWLKDHSIGGTPYVPGVMGLELLAEAFRKLQGATPMELQDVRFSLPIKLLRSKPAVVRSIATVEGDHAQLLLESDFFNPAGIRLGEPRKHFTARAPLQAAGSDGWAGLQKSALPEDRSLVVEKKGIYILNFHGPRFQVLSGMLRLEEKELLAVYRRPSEHLWPKGEDRAFLFSPMIVEAAFQTCGFRDLHFDKHLSLPDSADRIQIWTHGPEPRELFVHAFYRGAEEKSRLYDAVVFDEELRVWARLSGYRMIVQS